MRDNYDISKLNPRKNPYAEKLKRQVTINLKSTTVDYFKKLAKVTMPQPLLHALERNSACYE